jgi:CHAD domain-containing protein
MTGTSARPAGMVREEVRRRRARALAELTPALESPRFSRLLGRMESAAPSGVAAAGRGDGPAGAFARNRIDKSFRKLSPWVGRPADSLSDAELHLIRILFKRLRYTCEFFRNVLGDESEALIRSFVSFQDCLGLHQDAATATRLLTAAVGEVPAERRTEDLLLSLGSLLQVQRDIQLAQRKAFAALWDSAPQLLAGWRRARASGDGVTW